MLRLNPSRIHLEKKDLVYHKGSHDLRKNTRHNAHSIVESPTASSRIRKRKESSKASPSRSVRNNHPGSPIKLAALEQNQEDSLISYDPVPRGSRAFWDRVLAEAGTPTRTQSTRSGNGRILYPSDEWLEINRSTRASLEEPVDSMLDIEDSRSSDEHVRHRGSTMHNVSSSGSYQSLPSLSLGMTGNSIKPSLDSLQQPSSRNRFSKIFRRKAKHSSDSETAQAHDSTDLGFDGHSSEMQQNHDREKSNSTEISQGSVQRDKPYKIRLDRQTMSPSLGSTLVDDSEETLDDLRKMIEHSRSSPPPPSLSPVIDSFRHPSNTLPRSPLYISQAAASSSPEKSQDVRSEMRNFPESDTPSPLSMPPRRRRTYRPRSETYSFAKSEASSSSAVPTTFVQASPGIDSGISHTVNSPPNPYTASISAGSFLSPSSIIHAEHRMPSPSFLTVSRSMSPLVPHFSRLSSTSSSRDGLPGRPYDPFLTGHSSRSSSHIQEPQAATESSPRAPFANDGSRFTSYGTYASNTSSHSISSHRNLSPHAPPFIPRSDRSRNLTPQYPLPPPFGATSRTVSYSHAMPVPTLPNVPVGASPVNSQTPPPRHRSTVELLTTPHHSTFTIYNDSQPPNTQPQTPADLRHRVSLNPFNTAPVRSRYSILPPAAAGDTMALGQTYALPTRIRGTRTRPWERESPARAEGMVSVGGENVDTVTPDERERRREWNTHVRIGRDEQRWLDRSSGLERSPGI